MSQITARYLRLKSKNSWAFILAVLIIIILIGFIRVKRLEVIPLSRENAYDLLTEILSNYSSFLGIGLAILAILFTIIQLSYKRLSIIELVIENSYFIPLFYFAVINVTISSILLPLRSAPSVMSDFVYHRLAIIESSLFYVFMAAEIIVFYRTIQVMNFSHILRLYLKDINDYLIKESLGKLNSNEKNHLQDRGIELKVEMTHLITDNQMRNVNLIFLHYAQAISHNPTSAYLAGFDKQFALWFLQGVKSGDNDIIQNAYEQWHRLHKLCIIGDATKKLHFANAVPSYLYQESMTTGDTLARELVWGAGFIRLKERSISWLFEMQREKRPPIASELDKSFQIIAFLQPLLNEFVLRNDYQMLDEALKQLKLGRRFLGHEDEYSTIESDLNLPIENSEDIHQLWIAATIQLNSYFWEIAFYTLAWCSYQILEGSWKWSDKGKSIQLLLPVTNDTLERIVSWAISVFVNADKHSRMPIADWIVKDQLRSEGETTFLENSEVPLSVGMLVLLGRFAKLEVALSDQEMAASDTFVHYMNITIDRFQTNPQLSMLLGAASMVEAQDHLNRIKEFLNSLKAGANMLKIRRNVQASISKKRVELFTTKITSQWAANRNIGKIFELYGAEEAGPEEKLYHVGLGRINLKMGKEYFLDTDAVIVGDFNYGTVTNDAVWRYFRHELQQNASIQKHTAATFIDGLDYVVDNFPKITHAIIPRSLYSLMQGNLVDTGHFNRAVTGLGASDGGLYKEKLMLTPIYNRSMGNEIIGLQIPGAMILQRRSDPKWFEGKLQVDIIEIDDSNVEDVLLRSMPPGDPTDSAQVLTAKAGILIEVNETLKFKVLDPKQIVVVGLEMRND